MSLALAHKSVDVVWTDVDPGDRSAVVEASGQELVPVLIADHGEVVADSMRIVDWLEKRRPDPPLWPADAARRAEVDGFVEWFDRVWKRPPNAIAAERAAAAPDGRAIESWAAQLRVWLDRFEALLEGRDHLMGDAFGVADVCAFPFLKYGLIAPEPGDDDPFHAVLAETLALSGTYALLEAWIERVDARPRA